MKVRRRIGMIMRRRGRKYGVAGTLCLMAAAVVLALSAGMGARAADITLGSQTVSLKEDAEGNYLIETEAQLRALGAASSEETADKTFKLGSDLDAEEVTSAASGTFAGTFDGGGHVVTIGAVKIEDASKGAVTQGVLFGTVTGTVRNLIVDIKGDASYSRKSDAGISKGEKGEPVSVYDPYVVTTGEVSELSTGDEAAMYAAINSSSYTEVYLKEEDGSLIETDKDDADANKYKKYEKEKKTTTATSYKANAPVDDSFGIICGKLASGGTISQVSVNGSSFSVSQSAAENGHISEEQVETVPVSHYYVVGETDKISAEGFADTKVSVAPDVYKSATKNCSGKNEIVGELISVKVSAPEIVAVDEEEYEISYTVAVKALDEGKTYDVILSTAESGTWECGGQSQTGDTCTLGDVDQSGTEVSFTQTYNGIEKERKWYVTASVEIDGQEVSAKAEVSTRIVDGSVQEQMAANAKISEGVLSLEMSAPQAVEAENDGSGVITYKATVTNNSEGTLRNVSILYPEDVAKPESADVSSGWIAGDTAVSLETLKQGEKASIEFTKTASLSGTDSKVIETAFSASALSGTPAQKLTTKEAVLQTTLSKASQAVPGTRETPTTGSDTLVETKTVTNDLVEGEALTISASAPKSMVAEAGQDAAIEYTLSVKGKSGEKVIITAFMDGSPVTGTWDGDNLSENGDCVTLDAAGTDQSITFSYKLSEEKPCSISFRAETEDGKFAAETGELCTEIWENSLTDSGEKSNETIEEGLLSVSASVPAFQDADEDEKAVIIYTLKVSGNGKEGAVLKASEAGKWAASEEALTNAAVSEEYTVTGSEETIYFARTIDMTSLNNGKKKVISCFSIQKKADSYTAYAKTKKIVTAVYKDNDGIQDTKTIESNGLEIILESSARHVQEDEEITYTLTLDNENGAAPVYISSVFDDDWSEDDNNKWSGEYTLNAGLGQGDDSERKGQIIEKGKKVLLTQTITATKSLDPISATISGETIKITEIPTYMYVNSVEDNSAATSRIIYGDALYPGNNLYVGAFAGISQGTISESVQNINMAGAVDTDMSNGAVLAVGGVLGRNENTSTGLSDLYVKGSISASGEGSVTGEVAGKGSADAVTSVITAQGDDVIPDSVNWKSFQYYEEAKTPVDSFDLAWLVKEGDDLFAYSEPSDTGNETGVKVIDEKRITSKDLTYRLVYRARKQLQDQDGQDYFSSTDRLELGSSGYYQKVHAYATDGYYHYVQSYGEDEAVQYPFNNNTKPLFYSNDDAWSVERAAGSLEDEIVLHMPEDFRELQMYYNGDSQASVTGSLVKFPFEGSRLTLQVIPVWNHKIYEEFTSKEFTSEDREMLPRPSVQVQTYYQNNGDMYTEEFQRDSTYGAGSVMTLPSGMDAEGCSYEYAISAEAPDNGLDWSEDQGTKSEVSLEWIEYNGAIVIPDTGGGTQYLYVKVKKENYPDTTYCCGGFTAVEWMPGVPQFYYDYSGNSGTPIEGNVIMAGDVLAFDVQTAGKLDKLEYRISETELTGNALYGEGWETYESPVTISRSTGGSNCYIYTRMKSSDMDPVYGAISSYEYVFAGSSGSVQISPRTSDASAAASIASGAAIYLDSSSGNAKILYLVNGSESEGITLERVNKDVSGLTEDGTYYQSGKRWYRVHQENIREYTGSFALYNEQESPFLRFVHVVALDEDMEPGGLVSYAYEVEPTGQTSAPEAAIATRSFPDHADAELAQVSVGTSLSFTSLSPGAELYYVVGNGDVQDHEDEESGTMRYDSSKGITVEGDYGSQFTITIKAVKWNEERTKKELKDSEVIRYVYLIADQDTAVPPTATPETSLDAPATVIPGDKILLSTTTKGASIYYTSDGSAPQVELSGDGVFTSVDPSTMLYDAGSGITMPLDGSGYFTIRAVAVREDLAKSAEVQFVYTFPGAVQAPYANVPSGSVDEGTEIFLKNRTEGAVIYYTVAYDGNTPSDPTISSPVYDESHPIVVKGQTTIKAVAVKDGVKSAVVTLNYGSMEQSSAPTASINSGAMVTRGTRLTLSAGNDAVIYYTTDGSDPSDAGNSAVIRGSELTLDGEAGAQVTVKAYAHVDGKTDSEVVTFTYQISRSVSGVTADVENGSLVSNGSKVNLMTDVTDAKIYYTTDGSSPSESGTEGTVVVVNGVSGGTFTIKAVAVVDGEAGTVATFTYRIKEKPTAPAASPSGGVLTVAARVELSSSVDTIYYTTDGTTPTQSSTLYTEPILINRTTMLQAIAVSADGEVSDVSSFQYTAALKAEAPVSSCEDNTVLEPGTVIILNTETPDARIYYSTDGTDPTLDNLEAMLEYAADGISIGRTVTIKAVAYREDMQLSNISTFNYIVETIPAVELKQAEAERIAAGQLQDTDMSELDRTESYGGTGYKSRVLLNKEHNTVVSSAWKVIPGDAVLITEEKEYAAAALKNVKSLFGDDYVILSSYDIYLRQGAAIIQPSGEVEIGIPIPEKYLDAAVTIVYIDGNNRIQKLDTRREDGMAYAKVGHFSHYALVGLEDDMSSVWELDYLLVLEALAVLTALFGIVYYIRQKWKMFRKER